MKVWSGDIIVEYREGIVVASTEAVEEVYISVVYDAREKLFHANIYEERLRWTAPSLEALERMIPKEIRWSFEPLIEKIAAEMG